MLPSQQKITLCQKYKILSLLIFILILLPPSCKRESDPQKNKWRHLKRSEINESEDPKQLLSSKRKDAHLQRPKEGENNQEGSQVLEGEVTLDLGYFDRKAMGKEATISKDFTVALPTGSKLLSLSKSCTCAEVLLKLPNGKFLPLRKPYLPFKGVEDSKTVIRIKIRVPPEEGKVAGTIRWIFENGKTFVGHYKAWVGKRFHMNPGIWWLENKDSHSPYRIYISSYKAFEILSLSNAPPGVIARFHPSNSTKEAWDIDLEYIGKTPLATPALLTFSMDHGFSIQIPIKRRPPLGLRILPSPFVYFSRVPLLGHKDREIHLGGFHRGDRVLELRTKPFSPSKALVSCKFLPPKKKEGPPRYRIRVKNMGLGENESAEGLVLFRILHPNGKVEELELTFLLLGKK